MDNKINIELAPEEAEELRMGQDLYEMTKTPGFTVLRVRLEDAAFHSWVDPREITSNEAEKEWKWRELNAFWAANNARETLEWIKEIISKAEYLEKKKSGQMEVKRMTL